MGQFFMVNLMTVKQKPSPKRTEPAKNECMFAKISTAKDDKTTSISWHRNQPVAEQPDLSLGLGTHNKQMERKGTPFLEKTPRTEPKN